MAGAGRGETTAEPRARGEDLHAVISGLPLVQGVQRLVHLEEHALDLRTGRPATDLPDPERGESRVLSEAPAPSVPWPAGRL